jgi:hypothetical protein
MRILIFIFILLIPNLSMAQELGILCSPSHYIPTYETEPYKIKHRLAIAEYDKERLEKILNKIPRLKPDTHKWIKSELDSKDIDRYFEIIRTNEYHQYSTVKDLENLIPILNGIINNNKTLIETQNDELISFEKGLWVYYTQSLNSYSTINSLVKLYERNIIQKPKGGWEFELQVSICMDYVNKLIENIVSKDAIKF